MRIIECTFDRAPEILEILNEVILNSTALYEYKPRTMAHLEAWFAAKANGHYPVLATVGEDGALAGFASYGTFRDKPAYQYTIEHSVYVHHQYRGRGIGRLLLQAIIEAAIRQNYHMMIGGIDSANQASIRLHLSLGFQHCARIKQAGYKFGQWLDLDFYQLILPTPAQPSEG